MDLRPESDAIPQSPGPRQCACIGQPRGRDGDLDRHLVRCGEPDGADLVHLQGGDIRPSRDSTGVRAR